MPTALIVTVADILEVREAALTEAEVWSLLSESIPELRQIVVTHNGGAVDGCCLAPTTLTLLHDGRVKIGLVPVFEILAEPELVSFIAPELPRNNAEKSVLLDSNTNFEQILVFSLGVVLSHTLAYAESQMNAGPELFSLLNLMAVAHPLTRPTLEKLQKMCNARLSTQSIDPVLCIQSMFKSIMGSETELDNFSDEDEPPQSQLITDLPVKETRDLGTSPFPPSPVITPSSMTVSKSFSPVLNGLQHDTFQNGNMEAPRIQIDNFDEISFPETPNSNHALKMEDNFNFSNGVQLESTPLHGRPAVTTRRNESTERTARNSVLEFSVSESWHEFDVDNDQKSERAKTFPSDNANFDPFSNFEPGFPANNTHDDEPYKFPSDSQANPFDHLSVCFDDTHFTHLKAHNSIVDANRNFHSVACSFCTNISQKSMLKKSQSSPELSEIIAGSIRAQQLSSKLREFSLDTPKKSPQVLRALEVKVEPDVVVPDNIVRSNSFGHDHTSSQQQYRGSSGSESSSRASSSRVIAEVHISPNPDFEPPRDSGSRSPMMNNSGKPPVRPQRKKLPTSTSSSVVSPPTEQVDAAQSNNNNDNRGSFTRHGSKRSFTLPRAGGSSRHKVSSNARGTEVAVDVGDLEMRLKDAPVMPLKERKRKTRSVLSDYSNTGTLQLRSEMPGPEFFHKCRAPSIRLKAQGSVKRQNLPFLLRGVHDTNVLVILLNGQRVDVACATHSTAGDILSTVVGHMNLTEHYFFGLTHLKDGEHFFLDEEEKLSKIAPSHWRDQRTSMNAHFVLTLYVRLKYYPTSVDFIRNDSTAHYLYLQLRRDVIDERLQCDREVAHDLAALALQAEYGDRLPPDEGGRSATYFQLEHYLPPRYLEEEIGGNERVRTVLAELQTQYTGTSPDDAEMDFIKMCQTQREYGIHFHRLYKSKPSHAIAPTALGDPDTGTSIWVGIMPRGVIIFEEKRGERLPISQHPWHSTQTLQFDRKRFTIVQKSDSNNNVEGNRLVYYTDSHKKSGYFVKFASSQHKFGIKMRQWALGSGDTATLQRSTTSSSFKPKSNGIHVNETFSSQSTKSSATDSGISREASPEGGAARGELVFSEVTPDSRSTLPVPPVPPGAASVSIPSMDQNTLSAVDDTISDSLAHRIDNVSNDGPLNDSTDFEEFKVRFSKDPQFGLGLTLVDGEIQGVRGIYVKSVTPGGPADIRGGLKLGDKITNINGHSLAGLTRHDAVDFVRQSESEVNMKIQRLKVIQNGDDSTDRAQVYAQTSLLDVPRASTLPILINSNDINSALEKSSFNTEALEPTLSGVARYRSSSQSSLSGDEYHVHDSRSGQFHLSPPNAESTPLGGGGTDVHARSATLGAESPGLMEQSVTSKDLRTTPLVIRAHPSGMYSGLASSSSSSAESADELDSDSRHSDPGSASKTSDKRKLSSQPGGSKSTSNLHYNMDKFDTGSNQMDLSQSYSFKPRPNGQAAGREDINVADELEYVVVELRKNERGSLGIKVAGGKGQNRVYIKELVDEPALSCDDVMKGDLLSSVNGISTEGMPHSDVVLMLKNATSPVHIGLARYKDGRSRANARSTDTLNSMDDEVLGFVCRVYCKGGQFKPVIKTIEVTLDKPNTGSFGLSLAKSSKVGTEGIFIRVIAPDSVAAEDGTLKVGDRLWEINSQSVAHASPLEVVETLKATQGSVHLVVLREII